MVTSADINNLVDEVLWRLTDEPEPVSEHDLLAQLSHEDAFQKLDTGSAIRQQSQKHFLMMHVLYKLRERLKESQFRLQMRPDAICLIDIDTPSPTDNAEDEQISLGVEEDWALSDYYLDVKQLTVDDSSATVDEHKRQYNKAGRRYLFPAIEANQFY